MDKHGVNSAKTKTENLSFRKPIGFLSIRTKFILVFVVVAFVPLVFNVFLIISQYDRLLDQIPLGIFGQEIAENNTAVRSTVSLFLILSLVLICIGAIYAGKILISPILELAEWVRTAREKKFTGLTDAPHHASLDELGILATEINDSIKEFKEVSEREAMIAKEKTEFISVAAHQLRTPLTGLRWGLADVLDKSLPQAERDKTADNLYAITKKAVSLVNNLLDVAKMEEGKFGFELTNVDLIPILEKLLANFEPIVKKRSIKLNFERHSIPTVYADPARIEMVISNLLSNAFDYTPPGGSVSVETASERNYVRVSVTDSGIGIRDSELKYVFTKFFRGVDAIRTRQEGNGLGLYIVKNIVEHHGGKVSVYSKSGVGTTFSFTVPTERVNLPNVSLESFLGAPSQNIGP